MNLDSILIGLGYNINDALLQQVKRILSACDFDENEISHILNLNDKLKLHFAFVAISNSEDVFKIKCESNNNEIKKAFNDIVSEWALKYKFKIKKLDGKETYYIIGRA
ncbi:type II secretion system protein [Campylobacter hyointestinalis]|uniref:type II secretion system protein n=1 Tax=Campylobacter hyointestinalis TaxID=198 RepID=UPI000DCAF3EA|nr:type II secretion system protein [Campylobacter hyointestinalis]RAZ60127.1 type II secretion system protein [Campylobacter hyointestinalis subsp. lawsonii]